MHIEEGFIAEIITNRGIPVFQTLEELLVAKEGDQTFPDEAREDITEWLDKDFVRREMKWSWFISETNNLGSWLLSETNRLGGIQLLETFFANQAGDIDICAVMNSVFQALYGFYSANLHQYGHRMNFWYYKPEATHQKKPTGTFLVGTPNPNNTVLIVDVDVLTGAALEETAALAKQFGYNPANIFVYLLEGTEHLHERKQSALDLVENLLPDPETAEEYRRNPPRRFRIAF